METYVPPGSRVETSAPKQRVGCVLFPAGLWAEQARAAASFACEQSSLPTSVFQGGAVAASPALVHVEEIVHLREELLWLSDH